MELPCDDEEEIFLVIPQLELGHYFLIPQGILILHYDTMLAIV